MSSYYKPGTWNVICDLCGRQFKSDEVRKRWDGLIVCVHDYEPRHILDFIKPRPERTGVPFTRPEPEYNFVEVHYYVPPIDIPPVTPPPVVTPPPPPVVVIPPPVVTPPPNPIPVTPPSDPSPTGDITARADYARADYAQADRAA